MKNKLILGAAFLLAAITESLACTNLIVGKGASVDGSVIVSYSADSYGMFGESDTSAQTGSTFLFSFCRQGFLYGILMEIPDNRKFVWK